MHKNLSQNRYKLLKFWFLEKHNCILYGKKMIYKGKIVQNIKKTMIRDRKLIERLENICYDCVTSKTDSRTRGNGISRTAEKEGGMML